MNNLMTFESFGMNKEKCDRCGHSTGGKTIMSIFNQDVICMPCKEEEKLDPDYNVASLAELLAMRDGIVDFPGAFPDYKPLKRKH